MSIRRLRFVLINVTVTCVSFALFMCGRNHKTRGKNKNKTWREYSPLLLGEITLKSSLTTFRHRWGRNRFSEASFEVCGLGLTANQWWVDASATLYKWISVGKLHETTSDSIMFCGKTKFPSSVVLVNMHFRCRVWQAQILDVIRCHLLLEHPLRCLQDH